MAQTFTFYNMQYSKIIFAADLTALAAKGRNDATHIIVYETGLYEWRSSGTANSLTIIAATGGGVWYRVMSAGVPPTQLVTPTLAAVADGSGEIDVTIGSVTDAENYIIEFSLDGLTGWTEGYNEATAGEFNHTGLDPDTQYFYRGYVTAAGFIKSAYATDDATTDSASELTAGLIAKYTFDEGSGQKVFNTVGGNTADDNLIHAPERAWTTISNFIPNIFVKSGDATLTTNYANNVDGKMQAARLETGAGSGEYIGAYRGIRIQGYSLPAGQYTISLDVKSNTGSAQNIRMSCGGIDIMGSDLSVTTSWTRVEWTFTHPGGSKLLYFAINGSAGDALDILFDRLKINTGSSATAYVVPKLDMSFGILGTSGSDDPTWSGSKVNFASESQYAFAMTDTPVSLSNISCHIVCKVDPASTNQNVPISTLYSDGGFELHVGKGGNGDVSFLPRFKFRSQQAITKVSNFADGLWHYYCGTHDGTSIKLYVDRILMASFAASGLGSYSLNKMLLNHTPIVGGVGGNLQIAYAALYDLAHTEEEINQQGSWLDGEMAAKSVTIANLENVVGYEGDSITIDVNNYGKQALGYMSTSVYAENFATVGAQITTLNSRKATVKAWFNQAKFTGKNKVLSLMLGANDLQAPGMDVPAWIATVKAYCLEMKTDIPGLKILFHTCLPNPVSNQKVNRAIAIPLQVSDDSYYDGFVRFDQVTGMGADGDEANTTNYDAEGVHPTFIGHGLLRPSHQTGLGTLLV